MKGTRLTFTKDGKEIHMDDLDQDVAVAIAANLKSEKPIRIGPMPNTKHTVQIQSTGGKNAKG